MKIDLYSTQEALEKQSRALTASKFKKMLVEEEKIYKIIKTNINKLD